MSVVLNSVGYPIREGEEDCEHFLKTGYCKYKAGCKYNHPEATAQIRITKQLEKDAEKIQDTQEDCEHFLKTGYCKYKSSCKYNHPEVAQTRPSKKSEKAPEKKMERQRNKPQELRIATNQSPLNNNESSSSPLPSTPPAKSQEVCEFFVKSGGRCKYGPNCRYIHPENVAILRLDKESTTNNTKSKQEQLPRRASKKVNETNTTSSSRPSKKSSKGAERTLEKSNSSTIEGGGGKRKEVQKQEEGKGVQRNSYGFPIRPGTDECQFFMAAADCKYGKECKWSHPESSIERKNQFLRENNLPPDSCFLFHLKGFCSNQKKGTCRYSHVSTKLKNHVPTTTATTQMEEKKEVPPTSFFAKKQSEVVVLDAASLILDATKLVEKLHVENELALLVECATRCGARSKLIEANLPELKTVLHKMGMQTATLHAILLDIYKQKNKQQEA